jgi:ankyrin repeat protein
MMSASSSNIKEQSRKRAREGIDENYTEKRRRYDEIEGAKLTRQLEEKQKQFIDILSQLKLFRKKEVQKHEPFFKQLKELVKEGIINLTLTEPTGWTIVHIAIAFGRVDLLIAIQQYFLPDHLEQYKKLLCAETNKSKTKPADMKQAPYYEENISLLNEEQIPLLKKKQLAVILKMLVAHKEEPQRDTLYEQLQQLIAEGVDSTVTEPTRGLTILHHAVYKKKTALVKHILLCATLEQCKILLSAETNNSKSTVFSIAEYYKDEEILSLLREKQIEIFKAESAAIFKELKKLKRIKDKDLLYGKIEEFIKESENPLVVNDNGLNFLHYAAYFEDVNLVSIVKKGATPSQYQTLLHGKSKNEHLTPYGILKRQESENKEMLDLLNPEAAHNASQSGGQFTFFNPTLLEDESVPLPVGLSFKQ